MTKIMTVGASTYMPLDRCREEKDYEHKLMAMIDKLLSETELLDFESLKCVELSKVVLDHPLDYLWFFVRHRYWARDHNF